jgi:hypothetical protein
MRKGWLNDVLIWLAAHKAAQVCIICEQDLGHRDVAASPRLRSRFALEQDACLTLPGTKFDDFPSD